MSNNITKAVAYRDRLDRILMQGALTSDLNINDELLGDLTGAGQVKIAKMVMDGLADHVRGAGFVQGDVDLSWETVSLAYDRSRKFNVDTMDDEESLGIITATLMGEFARTKVVPEVDAVRFAKLAAKATAEGTATPTTYATASSAYDAVLAAEEFVQDNGTALQDCVFYCAPYVKTLLRKAAQDNFQLRPGEAPNTNFMAFDEMKLVTVPKTRFYTAIELYDGTSAGETSGGYVKADDGVDINFMIVNPESAEAIVKHNPLRYFAPDVNQADDAHLWEYRLYHDLFVYDNKRDGIYLSAKPTES